MSQAELTAERVAAPRRAAEGAGGGMTETRQVCRALVRTGLLETLRRKDLYVLLILTGLLVLGAYSFTFFGVNGLEIFVKDMAFTCVGLFSTIIAVTISARQLPDEIQRRTIYPLLARPITRWQLLLGKLFSAWLTSVVCFLALALSAVGLLLLLRLTVGPIFLQYLLLRSLGLLWCCAFTLFLSTSLSSGATVTVALLLTLGSGVLSRAVLLGAGPSTAATPILGPLFGFMPQYHLFDLTKKLVYGWPPVSALAVVGLLVYGVLIALFWVRMAWLRFRAQAV